MSTVIVNSEFKSMRFKLPNLEGFHVSTHNLPAVVLIKLGCSSAKGIRFILKVVLLQMVDQSRGHVGVVRSRSQSGKHD